MTELEQVPRALLITCLLLLIIGAIVCVQIAKEVHKTDKTTNCIKTKKPLEYKMDVVIHNNVADTTYIYQLP